MTDKDIADKVYIEPLNVKVLVEQIIEKEKPDSMSSHPGWTGRTQPWYGAGGVEASLEEHNVKLYRYYGRDHLVRLRTSGIQGYHGEIGEPVCGIQGR